MVGGGGGGGGGGGVMPLGMKLPTCQLVNTLLYTVITDWSNLPC